MALVLPTRVNGVPRYSFSVDLDGSTFRFDFHWNETDAAWYFDLHTDAGDLLLAGRKVVLGIPLLARFRDPRLPAGDINAVDMGGTDVEAGFNDLGARVRLLYFTAAEVSGG